METPIDELIQQEENPSAGMEHQPEQMPMQMQMPMQGLPDPSQPTIIERFVGQKHEFISVILVFLVLLLTANGIFAYPLKGLSMAWTEGRLNMMGTVMVAIMGSILYFVIKTVGKMWI